MADIFISYSGEDKTNVKLIAQLLEQQGWSVWWDRQIPIGKKFDTVIEEELQKSCCVIVVWTQRSVKSEWVKNEANEAGQLGKLVPVLLEDVPIPLAFKRTETAMLTGWQGEEDHRFRGLCRYRRQTGWAAAQVPDPVRHRPESWGHHRCGNPEDRAYFQRHLPDQ